MNSYRRGLRNSVLVNPKIFILEKVYLGPHTKCWSNLVKRVKNSYYLVRVVTIDAGASTTYIENSILIMENSDSGGRETLETPNMFQNSSILSLVTVLIWSSFILERFVIQVKVIVALFNLLARQSRNCYFFLGVTLLKLENLCFPYQSRSFFI